MYKQSMNNYLNKNINTTDALIDRLIYYGVIPDGKSDVRSHNEGTSDYNSGKHLLTPWAIWLDYPELTPFDHDIIKRVLRTKQETAKSPLEMRRLDYKKIIHICEERIRQIDLQIQKENQ